MVVTMVRLRKTDVVPKKHVTMDEIRKKNPKLW